MVNSSLREHTKYIDRRLRFRLRIYFLLALILIGALISNVVRGTLRLDFGLIGLIVGIFLGFIASRMFHTSWNKDAKKVVSRLDTYGIIILILYILFEVFREKIVGFFTHDVQVGTVGFAIFAGIMIGRVIGTRGKIIDVLREQKVFK